MRAKRWAAGIGALILAPVQKSQKIVVQGLGVMGDEFKMDESYITNHFCLPPER